MTVAYSRPLNIGDYVTRAKLHQAPGETASTIFGEFKLRIGSAINSPKNGNKNCYKIRALSKGLAPKF